MAAFYSLTTTAVVMVTFVLNADAVTDQQFQEMSNVILEQSKALSEMKRENMHYKKEIQALTDEMKNLKIQQNVMSKILFEDFGQKKAGDIQLNQNNTLEERVSLLELQVIDIQQDVTALGVDLVELEGDVNFLFDETVIQDERLFQLETETETIEEEVEGLQTATVELDDRVTDLEENGGGGGNSSVAELEQRVETLEGTAANQETRLTAAEENIQGLQAADVNFDARITELEENIGSSGNVTIAFDAVITVSTTISAGETLIFDTVLSNEGQGYDDSTGVFTVPPGGSGWYYFSAFLRGDDNEYGVFDVTLNDNVICTTIEDTDGNDTGTDAGQGGCGAVVFAAEGDEVQVVYMQGTDTTPLWSPLSWYYHGFVGFRI